MRSATARAAVTAHRRRNQPSDDWQTDSALRRPQAGGRASHVTQGEGLSHRDGTIPVGRVTVTRGSRQMHPDYLMVVLENIDPSGAVGAAQALPPGPDNLSEAILVCDADSRIISGQSGLPRRSPVTQRGRRVAGRAQHAPSPTSTIRPSIRTCTTPWSGWGSGVGRGNKRKNNKALSPAADDQRRAGRGQESVNTSPSSAIFPRPNWRRQEDRRPGSTTSPACPTAGCSVAVWACFYEWGALRPRWCWDLNNFRQWSINWHGSPYGRRPAAGSIGSAGEPGAHRGPGNASAATSLPSWCLVSSTAVRPRYLPSR